MTIRDGYGQTETVLLCGNFPPLKVKPGSMVYIHLGEGKSDPPVRVQLSQPIADGAAGVQGAGARCDDRA